MYPNHPDNDHWDEWRKAVERTGYNSTLKLAVERLYILESLTPEEFEAQIAEAYRKIA